jgi:hypothetical protein
MGTKSNQRSPDNDKPSVVREYDIGDTRYIVTASVKAGAREDAAAKVRRLIRKEIRSDKDDSKPVLPDNRTFSG